MGYMKFPPLGTSKARLNAIDNAGINSDLHMRLAMARLSLHTRREHNQQQHAHTQ